MKLHGTIMGMGANHRFGCLTQAQGLNQYIGKYGAENPPRALKLMEEKIQDFDVLAGYSEEPADNYPVAIRYAPLHLSGKDEYFEGTRPFYMLHLEGEDYREGKESQLFQLTVYLDKKELMENSEYSFLDQILGIRGISHGQMDLLRAGKTNYDQLVQPRHLTPVIRQEDSAVVFSAVESLLGGRRVVIRLHKTGGKQAYNDRVSELLEQIYSLLPAPFAAETGYASYVEPTRVRRIHEELGVKLYVLPAGETLEFIPQDFVILDLEHPEKLPKCDENLMKCLMAWAGLSWTQRREAMNAVFASPKTWVIPNFIQLTRSFFMDPFFKMKPVEKNLTTLEELLAQFSKCQVISSGIPWVEQQLRDYAAQMTASGVNLMKLKADAIVQARGAKNNEDRQKYTTLYRFADILAPGDASSHAVVLAQNLVKEDFRLQAEAEVHQIQEQMEQLRKAAEQSQKEMEGQKREMQIAHDKAITDQKTAHSKALAEQKAAHEKTMAEQRAAHQKALAAQKTAGDKALADAKKVLQEELNRAKSTATASGQQVTGLQKQLQEQKSSFEAEIRKLKAQNATAAQAGATAAQTAQLRQEMEELKKAHEQEIALLKQQRPASAPATGSAHTVSERAKQMMAAQILWNLARTEEQEAQILGPGAQ